MATPERDMPQIDGEDIIRLLAKYLGVSPYQLGEALERIAKAERKS
jgi:hypothetical protein